MNEEHFTINEKLIDGRYNTKFLFYNSIKCINKKRKKFLDDINIFKNKKVIINTRSNSCILYNSNKRNSLSKLVEFIDDISFGPHNFTNDIQTNNNFVIKPLEVT